MIRVDADLFRLVAHYQDHPDNLRAYLQGVRIEKHPVEGVLLLATDGKALLVIHDVRGRTDQSPVTIQLDKDGLKACKGGPKEHRFLAIPDPLSEDTNTNRPTTPITARVEVFEHRKDGKLPEFVHDTQLHGAKQCTTPFPDWRRVLPAAPFTNEGQPFWSADMIGRLTDTACALREHRDRHGGFRPEKGRHGSILMEWNDPTGPTLFRFPGAHNAFALLTPYQKGHEDFQGYPAFLDAKPPTRTRTRPAEEPAAIAA